MTDEKIKKEDEALLEKLRSRGDPFGVMDDPELQQASIDAAGLQTAEK